MKYGLIFEYIIITQLCLQIVFNLFMARKKKIDTKHLFHAICHLSAIPVFAKPDESAMIISQMLYGETCVILEKKNKTWFKISTIRCKVIGWVRSIQLQLIDEHAFQKFSNNASTSLEICYNAFNDQLAKNLVMGSSLPCFDGISFEMPDGKYIYNGLVATTESLEKSPEMIKKIARRYLNSPELSGGRTPFGIDGSALIQNVFSFIQIELPRYPAEQVNYGELIDFIELAQEGDLAFCEDKDQNINHAGIIIGEKEVLHVYGHVRIDKIDHFGFYNQELRKYTHKLRVIKRLL
ncbi:MAG: NLP/P60 protein [Bacteroidetes bacterium OLB9]|nr:MAG: NLP/P60 protein [Bacteroidetes bacterium OLB9]